MKVLINTEQTFVVDFQNSEDIANMRAFMQEVNEKGDIKDEKLMKQFRYYIQGLPPIISVKEIKEV